MDNKKLRIDVSEAASDLNKIIIHNNLEDDFSLQYNCDKTKENMPNNFNLETTENQTLDRKKSSDKNAEQNTLDTIKQETSKDITRHMDEELKSSKRYKIIINILNDTTDNVDKDDIVLEKDSDKARDAQKVVLEPEIIVQDEELKFKFVGSVFQSLREKKTKKWKRRLSDVYAVEDDLEFTLRRSAAAGSGAGTADELTRSQYSLVSSQDLTPEALRLWLSLPEEVKYDSTLAIFRKHYEKELNQHDASNPKSSKRLPYVASAPHLHNNLHTVVEEEAFKLSSSNNNFLENNNVYDNNNAGLQLGSIKEKDIETEITSSSKKQTLIRRALHVIKISILLAVWIFFTAIFMMYAEQENIVKQSSVAPGEIKDYIFSSHESEFRVFVQLSGPFLSVQREIKLNESERAVASSLSVWMEKRTLMFGDKEDNVLVDDLELVAKTGETTFIFDETIDFSQGLERSTLLIINQDQKYQSHNESHAQNLSHSHNVSQSRNISHSQNDTTVYFLRMRTNADSTVPFSMRYRENPLDSTTGVIYSCILLIGLYVLIIFEVINRTMAAVVVCTLAVGVVSLGGQRPSLPELISWLDSETLLLLFSMMLLVAIMAETGMFDALAVFTFEVTKGKMWPLIYLLCAITALLSTVLDNVTTVLLMTPVTIRLCEVMELDPVPILMSMVLYSNIGGTATPVGDPPNVIIASNKDVIASGINFTNFTLHMTLGILLVCVQTHFQLKFFYRDTNKLRLGVPREIQELQRQIGIWRRAAESLPQLSVEQAVVRERLERKVTKLQGQLRTQLRENTKRAVSKDTFQATLQEMKQKYHIRDKYLLIKASVALAFVVTVFFLHSLPELNKVSLGWTALLGAILLLILADREDLEPILHRVEWSTLLFFASLFVLMEALTKLGLIEYIGGLTEAVIFSVDESARLAVAVLLMLWVSGVCSAFVDNIPLTTMMVRVVTSLGSNPTLGLPMAPLVWALSFGACLGGNGTLIGASANVVCAGVAEQHGYKITFRQFFMIGFPIMVGHLIVISAYLLLCHCVFTWH